MSPPGRDGLRSPLVAVAALTVLAAALRLPFLETQSLTYDETFTREIVGSGSLGDVLDGVKATEATPPLFYAVGWAWAQLAGSTSDAVVRTIPLVAGILVVPAAFAAFRRLTGTSIALGVAALAAVGPVLVQYSLVARAYMLLVLFSVLSLWALALVLDRPTARRLAVWALVAVASLWTHYFAAPLVAAEVVALLWLCEDARARVLGAASAVGVAVLPLVALLADQTDGRSDNIGTYSLGERVEQTARQFAMGPNAPGPLLEGIGVALAAIGVAAGAIVLARRERLARVPLAIAVAVPAVSLLLDATGIENHFFMRNLLTIWTCFSAVAVAGLLRLRGVPLAAYVAVCLIAVIVVNTNWRYQNADWEAAAAAVPDDGTPVLVYPGFADRVSQRYLGGRVSPGTTTRELVVAVEPGRIGRRDLRPLDEFPRGGVPGFELRGAEEREGFRLLRYSARAPTAVDPARLAPDVLGGRPVLVVR